MATGFHDAALVYCDEACAVLQDRDVREHVAVHDQHVREFACLKRADLVIATQDPRTVIRGSLNHLHRTEPDILREGARTNSDSLRVAATPSK